MHFKSELGCSSPNKEPIPHLVPSPLFKLRAPPRFGLRRTMRPRPLSQKSFMNSTAFNGEDSEKSTTRSSTRERLNWELTVLSRAQVGTSIQATSIYCSLLGSATRPVSCQKSPSERGM